MRDRRIGKVNISYRVIEDAIDTGYGSNLFINAIPLDCHMNWPFNIVEYVLWHPDFDKLEPGEIPPFYEAHFKTGSVVPTWTRVK